MEKLTKIFSFLNNSSFTAIENKIMKMFKSFPALPANIINFIVSFGPFLALIGGVLSVLSFLSLFSLGSVFYYSISPFAAPYFKYIYLTVIGSVISGIMLIASYNSLKKRAVFGWRLVFWASNVNLVISVLSLNIFGAIIGALINWYILSQIRSKYI